MHVARIDAEDLHRRMSGGGAFLVCAYDTDVRFREIQLVGAISWDEFQPRLASMSKDQEMVFYCGCPGEASAAARAAEVMKLGFRNVRVLREGVETWKKAGFELVNRAPRTSLLDRILIPLDGSGASETVLYQAERLLCGRKGEVILFHAWTPGSPAFASPEAAESYLSVVQERLRSQGAPVVSRVVRTGPIKRSLPEVIDSERVSLVALSSHGRENTPRTAVAGTVVDLLKEIRVPIFLARAFQPGGLGELQPAECEAPPIRRILVPLDGSSACEAVMPYARELGQLFGALIVILHLGTGGNGEPGDFLGSSVSGPPTGPAPGETATPAQRIEFAAKTFSASGLETITLQLGGDPVSTILGFARPSAVDLIALTTHGRAGLSRLLSGAVAEQVLREAILPTFLVRSDDTGSRECLP
ncbi:MAG TPA: universal stress protein [Planctomycetota bacterium]|nr:universal stress protein [Planctomycetota bacterium]